MICARGRSAHLRPRPSDLQRGDSGSTRSASSVTTLRQKSVTLLATTVSTLEQRAEGESAAESAPATASTAVQAAAPGGVEKEEAEVGAVSWSVYVAYMRALGGWVVMALVVAVLVSTQVRVNLAFCCTTTCI